MAQSQTFEGLSVLDAKVLIGKLARDLPLMVKYLPSLMPLVG